MEENLNRQNQNNYISLEKSPKKFKKNAILIIFSIIFLLAISCLFLFSLNGKQNIIRPVSENTTSNNQQITVDIPKVKLRKPIGFLPSWIIADQIKINPSLLSQIIYFGLEVNSNGEIIQYDHNRNPVYEWTYFTSDYFSNLKKEAANNNTKILIALKSFDNKTIDSVIGNQYATNNVIKQLISLIKTYKLDGVNIDFEYVTDSDFPTAKYLNRFLVQLKEQLKKIDPSLIISIDMNTNAIIYDQAYDLGKIAQSVDEIILMAYDYHKSDSLHAGAVAPLRNDKNEPNITSSLEFLSNRVPFEKVILGIPFYGYEWQTYEAKHQSIVVPGSGALATYKRVKELINTRPDLEIYWDGIAESPWLTYNESGVIKQIYYEDERSIAKKMDLVKDQNLGGIAIWALGYEGNFPQLWEIIAKYIY